MYCVCRGSSLHKNSEAILKDYLREDEIEGLLKGRGNIEGLIPQKRTENMDL